MAEIKGYSVGVFVFHPHPPTELNTITNLSGHVRHLVCASLGGISKFLSLVCWQLMGTFGRAFVSLQSGSLDILCLHIYISDLVRGTFRVRLLVPSLGRVL